MTAVVTLTPAPVVDRTYIIENLETGKVNRALEAYQYLSGKGLNVARTLHLAKKRVSGVLPIGRDDEYLLFSMPQPHIIRFMPIAGKVRVNTAVVERSTGRTTNFNQHAYPINTADWNRVVDLTDAEVDALNADWLVVSGMQPINPDTEAYVNLTELFEKTRERGARVAVDTSGATLKTWGHSPLVNLIKPNTHELAQLVGHELKTFGDALDAGQELIAEGNLELVLASLGADGALIISKDEAHWAYTENVEIVNTTGAGDAALAGFLAASGISGTRSGTTPMQLDLAAGITRAVSWGSKAVSLPTTLIDSFEGAPVGKLGEIDRDRPLIDSLNNV